jgi:hypothetical protein
MPDRRGDRQLHLSFQARVDTKLVKADSLKRERVVTDLNSVKAIRHNAIVLERVIREGFTRKK